MRITARSLTAYSPLQVKLDMIHMVKSRINQNTAFAEGIIRRCMSAGDYDFPPASFVFIDTGEREADNQAADNAARLLITLNHYYMSQDVRIQNEYFINQLYRQIDYYMNQLRLNSRTEFRELNKIYKQIQNFEIYADQKKIRQDHTEILDRQLERILLSVENRESERYRTLFLSEKRLLNREIGGRTEKTKSLSVPFYRMIGLVLQSSRVNDYKTIWRQSVSRQYSLEAREFLNYLEHLDVSERNHVLEMLGEEEYRLYGKLRKMERRQWRDFAGQMAGRIEKFLLTARETGGSAAGRSGSRTTPRILESPMEPEDWLFFIAEIHKSTSLEEKFYKCFQENKRSFTTIEKDPDILEKRDLFFKNEFYRLLEQAEESEDVEQIWNLAGLDHVLKESAEEWRSYEAETLSEKKEQIKEWIGYMDSFLWERFLTLLSTKKELEALTEESYQYSQVVKSGQMKQAIEHSGKQIFERDQQADEQIIVSEQQAVMKYLHGEHFQHMDTDSMEGNERSQVFAEKFLGKEYVETESINSETWLSIIEKLHRETLLEKEFYNSLQENRRLYTTFGKNSDILENRDLILKNELFRLLEQTEESEDVEQIWNLAGLDHVLKESAEEWRSYEARTLSEKKEQIKEWIGYMDSSLWERFLTLLSTKKELEALTEESYQYSQMVKSGQKKPAVEQILVKEPQADEQVMIRDQQAVMEYLRGEHFQHMDLDSMKGTELSQIFAEKFLGKENAETESAASESWLSFIEEIHKSTSLEKEFYSSFQENRQQFTTLERNQEISENRDLILKNEFFRLLEQTEESEDVEQIWNLAGLDHVLKESAKEWRSYEAETLSEKKEQIKEWIGYMDSSLWERFLTLLSTKKELEALTEESYQYSQMVKSGQKKPDVEQILVKEPQIGEQVMIRDQQAVMEYLHGEHFQHMDLGSVEGNELLQVFVEKFLGKEYIETESVKSETWLSIIEKLHRETSLEKEFYNSLQENRRLYTTFEKNSDILENRDLILKNELFRLLEQTEEAEDVEQIWNLAGLDHVLKESAEEWRSYETETLSEKKEQIKEWIGYMDSSLWERFLTLFSTKKELEALTEKSYQYSQLAKSGQEKTAVAWSGKQISERYQRVDEQVLAREQQAVMEYLYREHLQHMDLNSVEGNERSQIFKEFYSHLREEAEESEDVEQTRLLHLLEHLSYEESAKIYSQLNVKKLFGGEEQDGAEQDNRAQEEAVMGEILTQIRLLETEQESESEVFLVQLLQKSLYEKEEEKFREQKMLWNSTITALYQDENLTHKAETMQIPKWREWDFPSANVQKDFGYEHRLLRLLKQMTEEELIHLYELQKTVMAAQAVNNMLAVMKSDSLSYSRREELWKTIADAVYHNSYLSKKMEQTQKTEQVTKQITEIEPSTKLPDEMVHRYAESSIRIEEAADRVLALLKSGTLEKRFSETRQGAPDEKPVWDLIMTKNSRLIQENIQESGELVSRWIPKQLLHTEEESSGTPDYGSVNLVPGHPSAQTAPGIVQTPQMPIDIETRIENTVKERVKDINFITRSDSAVPVLKEYETKIKTLSDQMALQRQEIEEIKIGSTKLLQNTDTRKIANTVMKQLQDQLRAERLRKGL